MAYAHPYMPHELDVHPDRERIEATIQEAVTRVHEDDARDYDDKLQVAEARVEQMTAERDIERRRITRLKEAIIAIGHLAEKN